MLRWSSHRLKYLILSALLISFAALLALGGQSSVAHATETSRYLPIETPAQERSNWCWAATGNAVADYFGREYSQNQFCNMAFGRALNSSCPNDQADLGNDQRAFREIGIAPGSYISATISYDTVSDEISHDRPVMTRILWSSGGGHMMNLIGYDRGNSTVRYHDPWPDSQRVNTSTYAWYVKNPQFSWTHTLYRIGA
ncbi:papain-like cysteine protease family protein [Brevibacterium sp.]|uniref:papain-like cysteine protease family protein n=1 Tax=Brevibacterium sp. TaxID=1701 RepID=UPI0028113C10|nr:papain-like cysteine protease family protein [Brevibacterium sp.]